MIIALGMFVDNAIVVSDDIKVNMEKGLARKDAVLKTGSTLTGPAAHQYVDNGVCLRTDSAADRYNR